MTKSTGYADMLSALAVSRPLIAEALITAERRRRERLERYLEGARFSGLEQLFAYLEAAADAYASLPPIEDVAFLVRRIRADYQTALEATLSGFQGVAADAMRDVMEIECLLLDFAAHGDHVQEWLTCDDATRRRKYMPVKVRERLQAAGVEPFANDDFEPVDYKAHSDALHVNPSQGPSAGLRGPDPVEDPVPFFQDLGFIEMFEHGNRILMAVELLRVVAMGPSADYEPLTPRGRFDDAHARTHQMQLMMMGFIQGPAILRERLGHEPSSLDLLQYIRDEIAFKGREFGPVNDDGDA
jgi:hypothetical protein